MHQMRKGLSAPGMYSLIRRKTLQILDERQQRAQTISLSDTVMSATAMFAFKRPSLLKFEQSLDPSIIGNLQRLFQIDSVPSDTTMRRILDPVPTEKFQSIFKALFSMAQRGKVLEEYPYLDGKYLLSIDGTGFFSSPTIHCKNCCVKNHRNGNVTYYHQMLSGVIVHPARKQVIPIAPEPISKTDGSKKNDCERVAASRLLSRFRREHPHLPVIIIEDGLSSNAPHIQLLENLKCSYILGCKPGDHKKLFEFVDGAERLGAVSHFTIKEKGAEHSFRFMNGVPLNEANPDCIINFIEYTETKDNGKIQRFSWVTDIEVNETNITKIMRGARARWKIENETFNTLKNLGYNFEHNFGHGEKNLSNNLAVIMILVFLVDQILQISCKLFQEAVKRAKRLSYLWINMRSYLDMFNIESWETFLNALAFGHSKQYIDTS